MAETETTPKPIETPRVRSSTEIYDESWMTSLLRPLLVVVLVGSADVVLVTMVARILPGLSQAFLISLFLLAVMGAVLGVVTTTVLSLPSNRIKRSMGLRTAELGLLLVLTRLMVWALGTGFPSVDEFLTQPINSLLDPLFMGCSLIVGLSWLFAVDFTDNLVHLGLAGDELYRARTGLERDADSMRGAATDRQQLQLAILIRWAVIGLFLILLAAAMRTEFSANAAGWSGVLGITRQPIEPQVMAAVIVYFLVGLVLISLGRLSMLRARWSLSRMTMHEEVTQRWSPFLIAILLSIGLIAMLLPLGGTFLLSNILGAIVSAVMFTLLFIYQLLAFIVLWIISLFTGEAPPEPPPIVPTPTPDPILPTASAPVALLPPWFGGAIFWIIVVGLVLYAATLYFRDKGLHLGWLTWLWNQLRRRWSEVTAMLRVGPRSGDSAGTGGGRRILPDWFRRKPSDPDALVRYYYFATLEEADNAGVARRSSETPLVYAERLEEKLEEPLPVIGEAVIVAEPAPDDEEAAAAVQALTDAFVAQRYAGERADRTLVDQLADRWNALQEALRKRGKH